MGKGEAEPASLDPPSRKPKKPKKAKKQKKPKNPKYFGFFGFFIFFGFFGFPGTLDPGRLGRVRVSQPPWMQEGAPASLDLHSRNPIK